MNFGFASACSPPTIEADALVKIEGFLQPGRCSYRLRSCTLQRLITAPEADLQASGYNQAKNSILQAFL